jgi:hypothetical protein
MRIGEIQMTDLEIQVDQEIRRLIAAASVAEEAAKVAQEAAEETTKNAIAARRAVEQALTPAANKGLHISSWEFRR